MVRDHGVLSKAIWRTKDSLLHPWCKLYSLFWGVDDLCMLFKFKKSRTILENPFSLISRLAFFFGLGIYFYIDLVYKRGNVYVYVLYIYLEGPGEQFWNAVFVYFVLLALFFIQVKLKASSRYSYSGQVMRRVFGLSYSLHVNIFLGDCCTHVLALFSSTGSSPSWQVMQSWWWEGWQSSARQSWRHKQDSSGKSSLVAMYQPWLEASRPLLKNSLVLPWGKCR